MVIARLHRWPRTNAAAIALQRALAARVTLTPLARPPRLLAGCDAAFTPDGRQMIAGVVAWDAETQTVVAQHVQRSAVRFPYVPGLLSFREVPGLLPLFRRLRIPVDAVLCDAQGLAHPRRLGLASHLGLWLTAPTIGCAKSRLCGSFAEPQTVRGAASPLVHHDEVIGMVVRTRAATRPLFVSAGNRCTLADAVAVTLSAATRYRLPEPTRLAHALVTRNRRGG